MEQVFENYKAAYLYHLDNEDTIEGEPDPNNKVHRVFNCVTCGQLTWGSHTSKYCTACKAKARIEQREAYIQRRKERKAAEYKPVSPGSRIKNSEIKLDEFLEQAVTESEARREKREAICEWNAAHCCPFFEGCNSSVKCFYCQRGINYAGAETVSNRRCPNNPIATDGSRYIQRAAYGKDSNSTHGLRPGERYDVADNMPQHLKVQLVERMQRMGRTIYLWSNGHVDITPDPDSNN